MLLPKYKYYGGGQRGADLHQVISWRAPGPGAGPRQHRPLHTSLTADYFRLTTCNHSKQTQEQEKYVASNYKISHYKVSRKTVLNLFDYILNSKTFRLLNHIFKKLVRQSDKRRLRTVTTSSNRLYKVTRFTTKGYVKLTIKTE